MSCDVSEATDLVPFDTGMTLLELSREPGTRVGQCHEIPQDCLAGRSALLLQSQWILAQDLQDAIDPRAHVTEYATIAFLAQSGKASPRMPLPIGDDGSITVTCTRAPSNWLNSRS